MKVRIGSYDVEISAKNWVLEEGTLNFLNELSTVYRDAESENRKEGYDKYADLLYRTAHDLYVICEENGLYEGIK